MPSPVPPWSSHTLSVDTLDGFASAASCTVRLALRLTLAWRARGVEERTVVRNWSGAGGSRLRVADHDRPATGPEDDVVEAVPVHVAEGPLVGVADANGGHRDVLPRAGAHREPLLVEPHRPRGGLGYVIITVGVQVPAEHDLLAEGLVRRASARAPSSSCANRMRSPKEDPRLGVPMTSVSPSPSKSPVVTPVRSSVGTAGVVRSHPAVGAPVQHAHTPAVVTSSGAASPSTSPVAMANELAKNPVDSAPRCRSGSGDARSSRPRSPPTPPPGGRSRRGRPGQPAPEAGFYDGGER